MRVRFFGTRGSLASPGPATLRYGGNTSCVEVLSQSGSRLIIDAGTGIAVLGRALVKDGRPPHGDILIGHTHADHINGLPFFAPFHAPNSRWSIYGPRGLTQSLRQVLSGQMQHEYFPIALNQVAADIRYNDLVEGEFLVGGFRVTARYLNHTVLTLGYRIEADGATLVYACDHEPHQAVAAQGGRRFEGGDLGHGDFVAGADLLIHDAQYRANEYDAKIGWGHSTAEYAVALAQANGVKRLALSHHDPERSDDEIDQMLAELRGRVTGDLEVFAAAEGQEITLAGLATGLVPTSSETALQVASRRVIERPILLVLANPVPRDRLARLAAADDLSVVMVTRSEAVDSARQLQPSLILFDGDTRKQAEEFCAEVRAIPDYGAEAALVLVAGEAPEPAVAGCDDVLTLPFTDSYARTKLRGWILRRATRWRPAPLPANESSRLELVRSLKLLDSAPEDRFDRITRIAAAVFEAPIALISMIDEDRQWFKSACGLTIGQTPRDQAFCAHAIHAGRLLLVPDALRDDRFADNPLVAGPPFLRFYAGYPLIMTDGMAIGTLCVMDKQPRTVSEGQLTLLGDLAAMAVAEFETSLDLEMAALSP